MERLDTGVVLCRLVELVQEKAGALKEAEGEVGCRLAASLWIPQSIALVPGKLLFMLEKTH